MLLLKIHEVFPITILLKFYLSLVTNDSFFPATKQISVETKNLS